MYVCRIDPGRMPGLGGRTDRPGFGGAGGLIEELSLTAEAREFGMSDRSERLGGRLEAEGDATVAFFQAIGEGDWERNVYSEGASWTIHEILTHFLGSEMGVARLIELVVMGEAGVPEDFDLDGYNERKVDQLKRYDAADLLARFSEARSRTIAMVKGFSDTDLDREGRHPFLGIARVEEMIRLMYRHNKLHQRDIRRVLAR